MTRQFTGRVACRPVRVCRTPFMGPAGVPNCLQSSELSGGLRVDYLDAGQKARVGSAGVSRLRRVRLVSSRAFGKWLRANARRFNEKASGSCVSRCGIGTGCMQLRRHVLSPRHSLKLYVGSQQNSLYDLWGPCMLCRTCSGFLSGLIN